MRGEKHSMRRRTITLGLPRGAAAEAIFSGRPIVDRQSEAIEREGEP
jgi:hypothetical protein